MIFRLFLLFTSVSLLELALLIWIGKYLGVLTTVGLVVLTAVIGASMAKFEGTRVWMRLMNQLRHGEIPGDTIVEGVLIFAGGITFLTPGFITDTLGILCLIPVTRRVFREWVKAWFRQKTRQGGSFSFQFWTPSDNQTSTEPDDRDPFESEFPDNT